MFKNVFIEVLGYELVLLVEEMLWNYINDLRRYFKIVDRVKVKVISKDLLKISVKEILLNLWDILLCVEVGQVIVVLVDVIVFFGFLVKFDDGKQCLCLLYFNV